MPCLQRAVPAVVPSLKRHCHTEIPSPVAQPQLACRCGNTLCQPAGMIAHSIPCAGPAHGWGAPSAASWRLQGTEAAARAWRLHLAVSSSSWWRCVGGATRLCWMPAEIGSLLSWVCGKKQCGSRSRASRAADAVHARALAPRGGRGNVAGGSGVAQATDTGQVTGWCPSRHATGSEPNPNCCPLPYSPSLPRACTRLHPMPRLAPVTSTVLLARRRPPILFPVLEGLQQSRHELGGPGNSGVL